MKQTLATSTSNAAKPMGLVVEDHPSEHSKELSKDQEDELKNKSTKASVMKHRQKDTTKSSKLQASNHCKICNQSIKNRRSYSQHMSNHFVKCPLCDHKDTGRNIR